MIANNKKRTLQLTVALLAFLAVGLQNACASGSAKASDETISFWVRQALLDDPRVMIADVAVHADSGIVKLTGTVRDLAEKNYAEKEAKKIDGVMGVINELEVKPVQRPDEEIRMYVRSRLVDSMATVPVDLVVDCSDGNVVLRGSVPSWNEKNEATLLASETSGVKKIRNNLKVTYPSARPDSEIRTDVVESLSRDVYLAGMPVDVSVIDGIVTLTGRVGNSYERERAEHDAFMVWNVDSVHNELAVESWENGGVRKSRPAPSDKELKNAVREELVQDLRIYDPYTVSVEADHGCVTLRGSVYNEAQKRIASQDARDVVGVGWVSNLLAVETRIHDDLSVKEKVKAALDSDYALWDRRLRVGVEDGIATLSGEVGSYFEKEHAEDVAARVKGVVDTLNHIQVNCPENYSDATLKYRIENRLATNWETRIVAKDIHVQVKDGEARLTGKVNTWAERGEADRLAVFTRGVRAVDNRITVGTTEYPWEKWGDLMHHGRKEITRNG